MSTAQPAGVVQRRNGRREELPASPPGAPWKWRLDGRGRPSWIPAEADAAWATVFEWELILGHMVHVEMPLLVQAGNGANGHPPDAPLMLARRAAGLRDLYKCSNEYIARQLLLTDSSGPDPRAAKRQVREGRDILHAAGILPWAAFGPAGRLPKRWWREAVFLGALGEWRRQAVSVSALPARTVGDAARDALTAAIRVERDLLLLAPALLRRAVPKL